MYVISGGTEVPPDPLAGESVGFVESVGLVESVAGSFFDDLMCFDGGSVGSISCIQHILSIRNKLRQKSPPQNLPRGGLGGLPSPHKIDSSAENIGSL